MNLTIKATDTFPLPASLFLKLNNKPWSTWGWWAKDEKFAADTIIRKQAEYGSKAMTWLCFNMVDPEHGVVNPFRGDPTAAQVMQRVHAMQDPGYDNEEVNRWMSMLTAVAIPGNYPIPTIYCGDDRATTRNQGFIDWYTPQVIRKLYPLVVGYNLISEASKSWSSSDIDYVSSVCHAEFEREPKLVPKPILVHQQGTNIGRVADILMYEFSFHPANAHLYSIDFIISELRRVLREFAGQIYVCELAIDCEADWARAMSRAIRDLAKTEPRIIALPGPV